jgi:hypothetical protein
MICISDTLTLHDSLMSCYSIRVAAETHGRLVHSSIWQAGVQARYLNLQEQVAVKKRYKAPVVLCFQPSISSRHL